jgi:hypothetical protein
MRSIPATGKVIVCCSPHIEPVLRDLRILLFRVAIVEITTMWSGSKAGCARRMNAAETAIVIEMSNGIYAYVPAYCFHYSKYAAYMK